MVLTKEEYIDSIKDSYPNEKIPLSMLVETIINKYGKDNSMKEDELDKILYIILGELKDLAISVSSDSVFSQYLKFHYNTSLGEGFITKK